MLADLQLGEFIYEQPTVGDVEYIFKHALTQEVAYNSVLVERRKLLHERIGSAIEASFAQSIDDHLSQLAHHYSRSSNTEKAIEYLDRAGQQAQARGALKGAEILFKQAIGALGTTSETPERTQREFNLQYALWQALFFTSGYTTDETVRATRRLRELGEKIGNPEQLLLMLETAVIPTFGRGEMTTAQQIADQIVEIAEQVGSNVGRTWGHFYRGVARMYRGDLTEAMRDFEAAEASYIDTDFSELTLDPRATTLSNSGRALWHLGMSDRARTKIRESISLSEHLKKTGNIAISLTDASDLYMDLGEPGKVQEFAERLFTIASEQQLPDFRAYGSVYRGWALAEHGRTEEGIALIGDGLDSAEALGVRMNMPLLWKALSEAQARAGQLEGALASIERAFSVVGETQTWLPGILWQRGELHRKRGEETEAASGFLEAIVVARRIGSRAYELRATTSLARLLNKQGRRNEARTMLAGIYNWFTEGFDTADLKDAKALLEELNA